MSKAHSLQILFASAAIMLCIAYYITFYHANHSGYVVDNYSPMLTILFVPVIASSLCFLFYVLTRSETYKKFGITCILIYLIPQTSLLIVACSALSSNDDFKLGTSLNGFAEIAPLIYFISLLLGSLLLKKID